MVDLTLNPMQSPSLDSGNEILPVIRYASTHQPISYVACKCSYNEHQIRARAGVCWSFFCASSWCYWGCDGCDGCDSDIPGGLLLWSHDGVIQVVMVVVDGAAAVGFLPLVASLLIRPCHQ